jgi:hypothetical protein
MYPPSTPETNPAAFPQRFVATVPLAPSSARTLAEAVANREVNTIQRLMQQRNELNVTYEHVLQAVQLGAPEVLKLLLGGVASCALGTVITNLTILAAVDYGSFSVPVSAEMLKLLLAPLFEQSIRAVVLTDSIRHAMLFRGGPDHMGRILDELLKYGPQQWRAAIMSVAAAEQQQMALRNPPAAIQQPTWAKRRFVLASGIRAM